MTKPVCLCLRCGVLFSPHIRDINRGFGLYCSISCAGKDRHPALAPRITIKCALCCIEFERLPSRLINSKSGLYFCSRQCKDRAQRLGGIKEIQPPHYGNAHGVYGYREIALKAHGEFCNRCGYNKYISVLRVHHIDRNRQNNDPSNLEVLCPTCHEEEHYLSGDGLYTSHKKNGQGGGTRNLSTSSQAMDASLYTTP